MIAEIPLNFKFEPKNSKLNYPQCRCGKCPHFYWNLLSVASRGSGKTFNVCKLIKHYEDNKLIDNDGLVHPLRTIVISPTLDANLIFNNLKSLDDADKYDFYSDSLLQTIIDDIKQEKENTKQYQEYLKAYNKTMTINQGKLNEFFKKNPDIFDLLNKYDFEEPANIKPKYLVSPVVIIVLDDLMGSSAFNAKKQSTLTNNLIKNRHNGISFAILSQSVKSVPKNIRLNCNLFFIGKFASKKVVLEDLYEEVSNILTPEQFEELYDAATREQYGSLIIDSTHKEKRFLKGLECELLLK